MEEGGRGGKEGRGRRPEGTKERGTWEGSLPSDTPQQRPKGSESYEEDINKNKKFVKEVSEFLSELWDF